jgi:hypothetical protein
MQQIFFNSSLRLLYKTYPYGQLLVLSSNMLVIMKDFISIVGWTRIIAHPLIIENCKWPPQKFYKTAKCPPKSRLWRKSRGGAVNAQCLLVHFPGPWHFLFRALALTPEKV